MTAGLISARRILYGGTHRFPDSDPASVMNRLFCGWVVRDRFNLLNHHQPFVFADIADPIPSPDSTTQISDICDARAKEIIALGKPITVMWSGGVDSTAILSSLLKNGVDKSLLTVAHAPSSVDEYPWFYKHLGDISVKMVLAENLSDFINTVADGVIVSGWCADQLFGSNIHLRNLDLYSLPWLDALKQAFKDWGMEFSAKSYDVLAEVWGGYAKALGVEVERWCEFAWLYNFGFKWSHVSQDTKMSLHTQEARDRVINFFEDPRFQRWSMGHVGDLREVNVNRYAKFYKRPLKQYIYSYTNDPDYLFRKGKVNSWALVKDDADYKFVETCDTDGYHAFRDKARPDDPRLYQLQAAVGKMYLKPEFHDAP